LPTISILLFLCLRWAKFSSKPPVTNPDVRAALEAVRAAGFDVTGSRAGYFAFAGTRLLVRYRRHTVCDKYRLRRPEAFEPRFIRFRNVGYPYLELGATQTRIKQAELRRSQAQRELSFCAAQDPR